MTTELYMTNKYIDLNILIKRGDLVKILILFFFHSFIYCIIFKLKSEHHQNYKLPKKNRNREYTNGNYFCLHTVF